LTDSSALNPGAPVAARSLRASSASRLVDGAFRGGTLFGALAVVGLLILLFGVLVAQSWTTWSRYGITQFLFGDTWAPNYIDQATGSTVVRLGALPMIAGTVLSSLIGLLFAAPIGILVAIFLVEFAPRRLGIVLTFVVELIAAIPSVVVGLWGLYLFAPFVRDTFQWYIAGTLGKVIPFLAEDSAHPPAFSVFTAGMVLAIMITPMVIAVAREVIRSVPQSLREGYVGLGATHWELIRHVILPTARVGLIGAVTLAFGRALGETIAVTMVIGNIDQVPGSVFQPGQSIASKIATNLGDVTGELELSALLALGVVLLFVTVVLSGIVRLTARRLALATAGG
jgi:phosphate transport system permease protein